MGSLSQNISFQFDFGEMSWGRHLSLNGDSKLKVSEVMYVNLGRDFKGVHESHLRL